VICLSTKKQWEYKIIDLFQADTQTPNEEMLNEYGSKGWELVSVVSIETNTLSMNAILKREKSSETVIIQ
jgi:hypothetical protein